MSHWPEKPVSLASIDSEASRFAGELAADDLPRIRGVIEAASRDAAAGSLHADDIRLAADCTLRRHREPAFVALEGTVRGEMPLLCQRCLEPLVHTVDTAFSLALCAGDPPEDWLGSLAERFERWDVDGDEFELTECLDEVVTLELPLAVAHANAAQCGPLAAHVASGVKADSPVQRPFADLASLMRD